MKKLEQKKLKLNLETLRNLKPEELGKVAGGYWPTESQRAGGCEITLGGCTFWCTTASVCPC
jgi:hypothetical protein